MLASIGLEIKYKGELVPSLVLRMARRTLLMGYADGNHRVPNVNRNSDGDFKFNLGNFENDWNSDNCLLCFCDLADFSPPRAESFGIKVFLPPTEHTADFIKEEDECTITFIANNLLLPGYLQKEC